ncbi:uncharacterized protein LOC143139488 [Alosa pseudoharengus]|uniref:uncharacterized protein LOC143139488 n=1 Tax=Alosa pseudoharengus TaxID=34774 RepID=UPI003F88AA10
MVQRSRELSRWEEEEEEEEEACLRGDLTSRASPAYHPTHLEQLFCRPQRPGPAGHGKSVAVQKLLLDWARGLLYERLFDLVLVLRCGHLDLGPADRSLVDVLSPERRFVPLVSRALQERPARVLIAIDGLEDLRPPLDDDGADADADADPQRPVVELREALGALLGGRLLPQCPLLVTTRPAGADRLSRLLKRPQRTVDMLGFSEAAVEQCFRKLLREEEEEEEEEQCFRKLLREEEEEEEEEEGERLGRALHWLRSSAPLRTVCSSPLLSTMVCAVLWHLPPDHCPASAPDLALHSATAVIAYAVSALLRRHCQGSGRLMSTALRRLSRRALSHILQQRTVSDPGDGGASQRSRQQLLRLLSLQGDEQTTPDPGLLDVGRFLCGLADPRVRGLLVTDTSPPLPPATEARLDVEEWLLRLAGDVRDSYGADHLRLHVLRCLHELHDDGVASRALEALGRVQLFGVAMTTADCWALRYCLLCAPANGSLAIWRCHVTADALRILRPALTRCHELELQVEGLSDTDIPDLLMALGRGKNLKELGVAGSRLCDESVQQVLACLPQQESVAFISLSVQSVSPRPAAMLARLLQTTEFELAELTSSDEETCCSHFSMDAFTVTLSHHCHASEPMLGVGPDPELAPAALVPSAGHSTECALPGLSFSVGETAALSLIDWDALLHAYRPFRAPQATILCFEERVGAFVSLLRSLPHLRRLDLEVSHLSFTWAGELLSLVHTCPSLTHASVQELRLKSGCGESLCSSISVERDIHYPSLLTSEFTHREECDSSGVCVDLQNPGPACSTLILSHSPGADHSWTQLLNAFHTLSSRVCEEGPSVLRSALHGVCGLKGVFVRVSRLTLDWASALLSLSNTCPSLVDISISDDVPPEGHQEGAVCSSLTLRRDIDGFTLSVRHPCRVDPEPELWSLSLSVSGASAVSSEDWMAILQEFGRLKHLPESPLFDERVDGLLSSVRSLSGLKRAVLSVRCLTTSWASRILSLIHTCPSLTYCSVEVAEPKSSDGDSVCSTLLVTRGPKDLSLTVQQAVCLSPSPELSGLSLSLASTVDLHSTNWTGYLQELHSLRHLTDSCPGFEEHVESLMAFLCSLSELRELKMKVLCVSAHWVSSLLQLIHTCPSLLDVRLVAGLGWLGDGLIAEEAVRLLMASRTRLDCTLLIEGRRCGRSSDRCSEFRDQALSCNSPVVISSHHQGALSCNSPVVNSSHQEAFQLTEVDDHQ